MKTNILIPEFRIYKRGVTENYKTILSCIDTPFDREAKIEKYKMLGYFVYDLKNNPI